MPITHQLLTWLSRWGCQQQNADSLLLNSSEKDNQAHISTKQPTLYILIPSLPSHHGRHTGWRLTYHSAAAGHKRRRTQETQTKTYTPPQAQERQHPHLHHNSGVRPREGFQHQPRRNPGDGYEGERRVGRHRFCRRTGPSSQALAEVSGTDQRGKHGRSSKRRRREERETEIEAQGQKTERQQTDL